MSTPWTRREFVQRSSTAAILTALPSWQSRHDTIFAITDADRVRAIERAQLADTSVVRDLAMRAIDAAKAAGATYAEARLTRIVSESFVGAGLLFDDENIGIGVRALSNGGWGFAASPYWDPDEAVVLARAAVEQAKINARASMQPVELGTYPIAKGSWTTPIRIDPFTISLEEKTDFVVSFVGLVPKHVHNREYNAGINEMGFTRAERAVATTEGGYFEQTLYSGYGTFGVSVIEWKDGARTENGGGAAGKGINLAGAGWELMLDAKLRDQIPELLEEAEAQMMLPRKPIDIGRYDMVCDAATMAAFVGGTLGRATQIDRALGYEANASGTSYLGPNPTKFLGSAIGSPLLNVTGDRSMARGLATVKWDDEGVEPETFAIIEHGALVDYQTTREQAAWLSPWYQQRGRPVRSHGCAVAESALSAPLQGIPNLSLVPGESNVTFDDLVADTKKGIALIGAGVGMDFQSRSGVASSMMREIVDGKLGAILIGGEILFDSLGIWKNLRAIGGPSDRNTVPHGDSKGQPSQTFHYTVAAVPGVLKEMTLVEANRR